MKNVVILLLILPQILIAQRSDKKLQKKLENSIIGFKGDIGIYVKSLKTGKVASINADTIFPTASIVKVPILIAVMNKINNGEYNYHQSLTFNDSIKYNGDEAILASLKNDTKLELSNVIMLMLTMSDNSASLWLQALAGTGTSINNLMDSLGYVNTRVNSRTIGREGNRSLYGWGQTTPKEMATIFEQMYLGKIISDSISGKMIRLLGRNYWDEEAISQIPVNTFIASKSGAVNASRNEILLVMSKEPYILSIFTKNNKDISWQKNNEAWQLTRKISKLLIDYYN